MGQDVEGMGPCERAICFSLFICLAVAVFTTVALIYLTSIVYIPVKRELEAGFIQEPVMCTTIQTIKGNCSNWRSCYEWCKSDSGGDCTQIYAEVRENGTNAKFTGCTNIFQKTCPTLNDPPANQTWDCKNIDNYQCSSLDKVFKCKDGVCKNITSVYNCQFNATYEETFNCKNRKNCIDMTGLFFCKDGICNQIVPPYDCKRVCDNINLGGGVGWNQSMVDKVQRNLVLMKGTKNQTSPYEAFFWNTLYEKYGALLKMKLNLNIFLYFTLKVIR